MKKQKKIINKTNNKFCLDKTEACEMRNNLAVIFPYHRPNCLTKEQFDIIESEHSTESELAEVYSIVFNSDATFSQKRLNQLKRIAKEFK